MLLASTAGIEVGGAALISLGILCITCAFTEVYRRRSWTAFYSVLIPFTAIGCILVAAGIGAFSDTDSGSFASGIIAVLTGIAGVVAGIVMLIYSDEVEDKEFWGVMTGGIVVIVTGCLVMALGSYTLNVLP